MDQSDKAQGTPVEHGIGAALCFALSAVVVLGIYGVLGVEKHVPDWILRVIAAAAFLFGLLLVLSAFPLAKQLRFALGFAVLASFLIVANWVAFGPGERRGARSFSLPGFGGTLKTGNLEARIVSGIAAILLDLIVAGAIIRDIRRWRARRR